MNIDKCVKLNEERGVSVQIKESILSSQSEYLTSELISVVQSDLILWCNKVHIIKLKSYINHQND